MGDVGASLQGAGSSISDGDDGAGAGAGPGAGAGASAYGVGGAGASAAGTSVSNVSAAMLRAFCQRDPFRECSSAPIGRARGHSLALFGLLQQSFAITPAVGSDD